jgi:hypothetical protein
MGIPFAIIAALIGITGIVINIIDFDWFDLLSSFALFILAAPLMRIIMMVHANNDRLDELEKKA